MLKTVWRKSFKYAVFFAETLFLWEKSPQENLETLKEYKAKCLDELKDLEQVSGKIEHYAESTQNIHDSVYWNLTARFGELHIKMCLDFADEAIQALENIL